MMEDIQDKLIKAHNHFAEALGLQYMNSRIEDIPENLRPIAKGLEIINELIKDDRLINVSRERSRVARNLFGE